MGGKIIATDISNLTVASVKKPKKVKAVPNSKQNHIDILEDKVDNLELEVASLKKKLALKPTNIDWKTKYEKILPELQKYFDTLHPF